MVISKDSNNQLIISELVKANAQFICALSRIKSYTERISLIKKASPEQLLSLVKIALNILHNKISLNIKQRKRLVYQANTIRHLSRLRSEKSVKRLFLKNEQDRVDQKGSGVTAVVALA